MTEKDIKEIFERVKPIRYSAIKTYQDGSISKIKTNGESIGFNTSVGEYDSVEAAMLAASNKDDAEVFKLDFEAVMVEAVYEEIDSSGKTVASKTSEELRIVNA